MRQMAPNIDSAKVYYSTKKLRTTHVKLGYVELPPMSIELIYIYKRSSILMILQVGDTV